MNGWVEITARDGAVDRAWSDRPGAADLAANSFDID
jgi:hypothetical protein